MTFEELWKQVQGLPGTAKDQIPGILSEETKKRLEKLTADEVAGSMKAVIDEINHGSVLPLDELVNKRL